MAKWGNYFIIGAVISMIVPFLLDYFELLHNHVFWPTISILLISGGILFHVINGIKKQLLNGQTILLLISVWIIVIGFSMVQLKVLYAKYILLLGMILVLVWLFSPNKKKQ